MVVLAVVAVAGLRPWEADSVDPHLGALPGSGAVGEAVVVASDSRTGGVAGVAPAAPALEPVPAAGGAGPVLAVAQNQAVRTAVAAPTPAVPEPVPAGPPPPAPAPAATVPPTVADGDGGDSGRPSTAVVEIDPAPGCEGDEYEITVKFGTRAAASDEAELTVLIRRVAGDGSESEIRLEGTLDDVGDLLQQVASEGDCVAVRLEPTGEEQEEAARAAALAATAGRDEELEPVAP